MRRAILILGALAALGGGAWAVYAFGPERMGGPTRVNIGELPLPQLDTVSLKRRVITASVTGHVMGEVSTREVLVSNGAGTIAVRLAEDHGIRTGATLLAVGRLRQPRGAPRYLDAVSWVDVERALIPLQLGRDSVRLVPDSTRLGDE